MKLQVKRCNLRDDGTSYSEAHFKPCGPSVTELYCEKSQRRSAVHYFYFEETITGDRQSCPPDMNHCILGEGLGNHY